MLKTAIQAMLGSLIIHVIFFIGSTVVGIIKTKYYVPTIVNEYDHIVIWEQKTSFGLIISPNIYLLTFVGVAAILAILISIYKSAKRKHKEV